MFKSIKRKFKKLLQLIGYWLVDLGKPDSPFSKTNLSFDTYIRLAKEASNEKYDEIDSYEALLGFKVDKSWLDELALHTQIVIKDSKLCYAHGRVLYSSLSSYLTNLNQKNVDEEITILETGTARGYSAICMAKALKDNGFGGKILTFDLIPNEKKMFWNCIDDQDGAKTRLELLNPWKELLDEHIIFIEGDTRHTLKSCSLGRVNFAFLDGAHTYEDVMFEFFQIKDKQLEGDVIVYDDYSNNLFPGIVKAVDHICKEYKYERKDIFAADNRAYVIATKK